MTPPRPVAPRGSHPEWWSWAKREHKLTPEAVLVLFALCDLGDDEWICQQSAANIAQCAGIARSSVQKAVDRLVEIGAVVDLGRDSRREPSRLRVSPVKPATAAQLRLLASPAKRRAVNDKGDWIVAVD